MAHAVTARHLRISLNTFFCASIIYNLCPLFSCETISWTNKCTLGNGENQEVEYSHNSSIKLCLYFFTANANL